MDQDAESRRQAQEDAEIREQFGTDVELQPLDLRQFVQDDGTVLYRAVVEAVQGPAAQFELTVIPGYLTAEEHAVFEEWLGSARAGFAIRARDTLPGDALEALDGPAPAPDGASPVPMVRYRLALLQSDTPRGETVYWEALIDPAMYDTLNAGRTNRWHSRSGRAAWGSFSVDKGPMGWVRPDGPQVPNGRSDSRLAKDLYVKAYGSGLDRYWFYGLFSDQN